MRDQLCCAEAYLGSAENVAQITAYLSGLRGIALSPQYLSSHLRKVRGNTSLPDIETKVLAEVLASSDSHWFDTDYFRQVIEGAGHIIRKRLGSFALLQPESYVVGVSHPTGDLGGFYGDYGVGFQYELNLSFSELLNPSYVEDPKLRALELARNYVHDSFHASTYRSFVTYQGKIHRYQYGINFRLPTGQSYSGSTRVPGARYVINLNTLMDGVAVLVTADAIHDFAAAIYPADDVSAILIGELLGNVTGSSLIKMAAFASQVVCPAKEFIAFFGGEISDVLQRTIISGDIDTIRGYFNRETVCIEYGNKVGDYLESRKSRHPELPDTFWECLFLSPDFLNEISNNPLLANLRAYCRMPELEPRLVASQDGS
jgi:hypothetical protein